MKVLPLVVATLPLSNPLYRVQEASSPAGAAGHSVGNVRLPPTPGRRGRFDLGATFVAAFALDAEAAVDEIFARSAARAVSLSPLAAREMSSVKTTVDVPVCDARPQAHDWPFVTAARCAATQDEADAADEADGVHRLFGVLDASAQRQGGQCVALFKKPQGAASSAVETLSSASTAPLHVSPTAGIRQSSVR